MNKALVFVGVAVGLYLVFLIVCFCFVLGAMRFDSIAKLEQKLSPSTFVFWQEGEFFRNPPLFGKVMKDPNGQLSTRDAETAQDVDIWVFLLDGFDDIRNVGIAEDLELDVEKVARLTPGTVFNKDMVSLKAELHPIPFWVERKRIVVFDSRYLKANYLKPCFSELVYNAMVRQQDHALWKRCTSFGLPGQ